MSRKAYAISQEEAAPRSRDKWISERKKNPPGKEEGGVRPETCVILQRGRGRVIGEGSAQEKGGQTEGAQVLALNKLAT